jgi:diadenylate cyclase
VLLLAALVFAILKLLSGTRAMTQLRGAIMLILLAVLLGKAFDLAVVNYIVEHSLTAILIGAAIIFQPEVRRGLDRLGRTGLQGVTARRTADALVEPVAQAVARMSASRHGGLLVIERDTGLQDVIETGVPVDAKLSAELINGIFFPNSPLHDMAVVLRGDRVVAASCQLPLSTEVPHDGRYLGTRHRAAVGITEQTDAVAVVVSEETGDISVAIAGQLTKVADERRLTAVLRWILSRGVRGGIEPRATGVPA